MSLITAILLYDRSSHDDCEKKNFQVLLSNNIHRLIEKQFGNIDDEARNHVYTDLVVFDGNQVHFRLPLDCSVVLDALKRRFCFTDAMQEIQNYREQLREADKAIFGLSFHRQNFFK